MIKKNFLLAVSGNEASPQTVTAFHKGERKKSSLSKKIGTLKISRWVLFPFDFEELPCQSLIDKYEHQYPNNSCNFQLIIDYKPSKTNEAEAGSFILRNLSKLLDNDSNADIHFNIQNHIIAAHSAIISASSPVFAAMLEHGKFKEGVTRTVEIEDINVEVFKQLLKFLYTGVAPDYDSPVITEQLFVAADKYQVDFLKNQCEDSLISKLAVENVIHCLVLGHLYSAPKLQEAAEDCLVINCHEVLKCQDWKELSKSYTDLFFTVCNRMVNTLQDVKQLQESKIKARSNNNKRQKM